MGWMAGGLVDGCVIGWMEGIAMFCPTACRLIPPSTPRNPGRLVSGLNELIKVFSPQASHSFLSGMGQLVLRPKANRLNVSWGESQGYSVCTSQLQERRGDSP